MCVELLCALKRKPESCWDCLRSLWNCDMKVMNDQELLVLRENSTERNPEFMCENLWARFDLRVKPLDTAPNHGLCSSHIGISVDKEIIGPAKIF